MIEMIKTMNEISPYIGLSGTFHRFGVERPSLDMSSSGGRRWSCYAKKWEAWSIVSGCWTYTCTWWSRHRDPLWWWCNLVDNWYQINTPLQDIPQDQRFESPQLFPVVFYSFGLSVAAYNISCMSYISLHSSQDVQSGSNSLLIFEKIVGKKNSEWGIRMGSLLYILERSALVNSYSKLKWVKWNLSSTASWRSYFSLGGWRDCFNFGKASLNGASSWAW